MTLMPPMPPIPIPNSAREPRHRVLLLALQPFLREIYGQEVRNWAELCDQPLDLIELDDAAAWLAEAARHSASLAIIDLDGLLTAGLDFYHRVRSKALSAELPLIALGSPASVEPLTAIRDARLRRLQKPLRFGELMTTVRDLARDHQPPRK